MKYSKPMKANPRQFTINQHVFPIASFRRFTNDRGLVMVRCFHPPPDLKLHPTNPMFCAQRAWDERTERGLMKDIEYRFQTLADEIINERQTLGPAAVVRSESPTLIAECRIDLPRSLSRLDPLRRSDVLA